MALTSCSQCGNMAAPDARGCPWCGRRGTSYTEAMMGTFIFLALLAGIVVTSYVVANPQPLHLLLNSLVDTIVRVAAV